MTPKNSILIEVLGRSPKLRIIDFLIDNFSADFSKKGIMEGSGVSKVTFYNEWNGLVKFGIVTMTRKFGKTQLFRINKDNGIVKKLMSLEFEIGTEAIESKELRTNDIRPEDVSNQKSIGTAAS